MSSQVTLAYSINTLAVSQTALQAALAAVPSPVDLEFALGLRKTSDSTTTANPCVRTIVYSFLPSSTATATATIQSKKITAIAVTGAGADYIQPPNVLITSTTPIVGGGTFPGVGRSYPSVVDGIVRLAQAKAFLKVVATNTLVGGSAYSAPTIGYVGGFSPANANKPPFNVMAVNIAAKKIGGIKTKGGFNYTSSTVIQFKGQLAPGGTPATAVPTIVGGKITAVKVTSPGLYQTIPQAYAWDPGPANVTEAGGMDSCQLAAIVGGGTPATATATVVMGVITAITIVSGGDGYIAPPAAVITDSAGSGASFTPSMGVGRIDVLDGGAGYEQATVTLQPYFKGLYPDGAIGAQAKPFFDPGWMQVAIQSALATPVIVALPLLA